MDHTESHSPKKGLPWGKIIGFGCLGFIVLLIIGTLVLVSMAKTGIHDELEQFESQLKEASTSEPQAELVRLRTEVSKMMELSSSRDMSFLTGATLMGALASCLKDDLLDKDELESLFALIKAISEAGGDLDWEELGDHEFD